ncbi:GAF domain-containing protein [Rhizobacter sp. Root1221]|uniref:GAF domain-containing protein n=1 Tax=Rhizobacter sp. Root1221 TaxID=1736433 RepID=UPI0006F38858|nr:GAF domain-containing protein [Rhizobacter sp. Root1221]KQV92757.1 histidine kinase [Rhizobacter sp. Root1221]
MITPANEPNLYTSLFAAYPDALLLVDDAGLIRLSNPAADTLLGYAPGELIGRPVDALVPDSIRPRHANFRHAYAHQPRPRPMGMQMDLVAKRRDGSEVMVEIALSPLQGHGLPYVVAAIRGISDYPRVRHALARAHYSESVARIGRLAVDTRDPQVLLQRIPAEAAEALGADTAVLFLLEPHGLEFVVAAGVGLLPGEGVGTRVPNDPRGKLGFVLAHGAPVVVPDYRLEHRFGVPAGYLDAGLVSALAVPLTDRGRDVGLLTVRSRRPQTFGDDEVRFLESLSNLLAATLQRVQTEETLRHAQRLESVGQLTGGIAHDFNNLLTVIQGNLQVLEDLPAVAGDDHARVLVAAAGRASRRGADLTGKLLAFSRRQVLSPSAVDVPAMVQSLADMLRRTLDQRIRLQVHTADTALPCLADPGQLESTLLNIAINARDAMPSGGALSFRVSRCDRLPPALCEPFEITEADTGGFVSIAIADTGAGMSDAVKERAFEPFFTTKEAGRGTGLGLSTAYGFVKQSRGAVALDSVPGEGTTVTLYLPLATTTEEEDTPGRPDTVPPGLRVLLVEDEPEVRAVAVRFLTGFGCHITSCATAEQALLRLDSPEPFDLLLSDIALGAGLRGTDLAREAQARRPHLNVLLVSGFSAELIDMSETAPASWELLAKPYSRQELQHAIARAVSPH